MHYRRIAILLLLAFVVGVGSQAQDVAGGAAADSYRVGVEDRLRVWIWGEDELSGSFNVLPDGTISLPLVNDLQVAGLRTSEIRAVVAEALSKYVRDPNVTVIVEAINSYRVYFLGEVTRQGPLQFYRPTRVLQGIAAAGGLTEFASKREIVLVREEEGEERRMSLDYRRLLNGESENIVLEPGDTLIVR